jgi:hypothetical protein
MLKVAPFSPAHPAHVETCALPSNFVLASLKTLDVLLGQTLF